MGATSRQTIGRAAAIAAIPIVLVVLAVVLLRGGSQYIVHVHMVDAGQLVKGDLIEVGGDRIGTVKDIRLTNHNQADVVMKIHSGEYDPLHRGTLATVRTVGLSGVANRFVELTPGPPGAAKIPNGGVMQSTETRPLVDLDQILNELDAPTRARLQALIKNGAQIFAGATGPANRALQYLDPALAQTAQLARELARNQVADERLITSSARVVKALSSRSSDVTQGITSTAATLRAVAGERTALEDSIARAPETLRVADSLLRDTRTTITVIRPTVRALQPVAPQATRLLQRLSPTARRVTPVLAQVRSLLPALKTTLDLAPGLSRVAIPALTSTTSVLRLAMPIAKALNAYAPEVVLGLSNSFGGTTSASYDANGHFARVAPVIGSQGTSGILTGLTLPPLLGQRTGLVARCPGGATEPAFDKSNPYIPDASLCNPKDDKP
jgi:phospholipid/cholesterol/gamma-HCH transport system substrate-binding protein